MRRCDWIIFLTLSLEFMDLRTFEIESENVNVVVLADGPARPAGGTGRSVLYPSSSQASSKRQRVASAIGVFSYSHLSMQLKFAGLRPALFPYLR